MASIPPGISNFKVLKPSRRPPKVGDAFVYQLIPGTYHFGRVIRTNAKCGGGDPNMLLLYFYSASSSDLVDIPILSCNTLLIPPKITNRVGWLDGVFQTVKNVPLGKEDVLPQHCFAGSYGIPSDFCDEYGNPLMRRFEPCGQYGVGSYLSIEDQLSDALGVPRIPHVVKRQILREIEQAKRRKKKK